MKIKTIILSLLFALVCVCPAYAAENYFVKQPSDLYIGARDHDFVVTANTFFSAYIRNTTPSPRSDGACAVMVRVSDTLGSSFDINKCYAVSSWSHVGGTGVYDYSIANIKANVVAGQACVVYLWTGSTWVTSSTFTVHGTINPAWECDSDTWSAGFTIGQLYYTVGYPASYKVYVGKSGSWSLIDTGTTTSNTYSQISIWTEHEQYPFTTADNGKYIRWEVTVNGSTYTHEQLLEVSKRESSITFDIIRNDPVQVLKCEDGTRIGQSAPKVERDGYKFLGWFTKSNGGVEVSNDIILKDRTVYAQWEVIHYHNYRSLVSYVIEPTCTDTGVGTYKCSCGDTTTKEMKALGHLRQTDWSSDETYHYKSCTRCGVRVQQVAHRWGADGTLVPTCTATGYNDYKCSVCGKTRRDTIAALGHTYEWKWYSQDGVANAYKQQTCTRCGALTGDKVYSTYTVTYITKDYDNNTELARSTVTKTFNDVAKGSDLGKTDTVYNNITYKYYSETTATVRGACTVYRNMRKKSYIVHYNANGGTGTMADTTWDFDTQYNLPGYQFSKTGYTFQGWAKSATGAVVYTDVANVTNIMARTDAGNQVTLYAIWKANPYVVSFEAFPATNPANKTVTFDSTYGTLPTLTASGYVFKGWEYIPDDETHIPITSNTIVYLAENHTLNAVWEENAVTVTYVSPSKSQVVNCLVGYKTTPPFTPVETGLIFKYWSTSQGGAEFNFGTAINKDLVLYAVFESKKIDIVLPGVNTITKDYPAQFGELPVPVQPGKDFEGWYYDEDFKQPVNPTDNIPAEDITLYPKYETSVYKLTLKGSPEIWDMHYQDTIPELPTPKLENKVFKYWQYENQAVYSGNAYKWEKSVELVPVYEELKYTIVLPDGTTKEVNAGDKIGTLPPAPEVTGKTPNGYVDQFGNPITSDTIVDKDMVINHNYRNKNVTLTLVDGNWNTKIAQEAGVTFSGLPTRSKAGYFFSGWALYENGRPTSGPVYQDTTLYAVYEADYQNIYLVDENITIQKKTGQPIGTLPDASKDGNDFEGWFDSQGNKVTAETIVTGPMDLHAKFTPIHVDTSDTVEIRYWSDGVKINTVDLPRGEILWDPGAPALKDVETRKFMFWSQREGGSKYDFGKRVSSSIDLYAQWN